MVLYVDVILHRIIEYNKLMRHFIRQLIVLARRDAATSALAIRLQIQLCRVFYLSYMPYCFQQQTKSKCD